MGREAIVQCKWAEQTGLCKVILESSELIVRGALRRRVPLAQVSEVSVEEQQLRFRVGGEQVSFHLGAGIAQKWAKAIVAPPPTLATKLGISSTSRLLVLGEIKSGELKSAIADAVEVSAREANLVIASVTGPQDLDLALARILERRPRTPLKKAPPTWIVYPKGSSSGFGERPVREIMRQRGFLDTKVASVSAQLTALRFIQREP